MKRAIFLVLAILIIRVHYVDSGITATLFPADMKQARATIAKYHGVPSSVWLWKVKNTKDLSVAEALVVEAEKQY